MMTIEKLLEGLMISAQPFVICRTTNGPKLNLPAVDFPSLHYVVAGSGILTPVVGAQITLSQGSIVILPAGMSYQIAGDGDDERDLEMAKNCVPVSLGLQEISSAEGRGGIVLACSNINATYQQTRGLFDYLVEPIASHPRKEDAINNVLTTVLNEMADPKPGSKELISLLMKQCLVYLLRRYCESGNCQVPWLSALDDPQLSPTLEQMINEPGRRYTLELLADNAGMSRSAFAQRFKDAFGRSAMDFLKELRLQRAAHLLHTTRRPIKSIADMVGFDSRSHFSRSFTDYFNVSPGEFREESS